MVESGRDFGLEFMRKTKFKKKITNKRKLLNMMVPSFLYTNSMLLHVTRTTRAQDFTFFEKKILWPFSLGITYKVNNVGPWHIASLLFSILQKVTCMRKYVDQIWL